MLTVVIWIQRALLWVEAGVRAGWGVGAALGAALGVVLLGPPAWMGRGVVLAGVAAACWLIWRGRAAWRWPGRDAAERRMEAAAGLRHAPLAAARDAPAAGAGPLWEAHLARARLAGGKARLSPPRPALPVADPRALRVGAGLLLLTGLVVAGPEAGSRLARLIPGVSLGGAPRFEAWFEPPSYTGEPVVFLTHGAPEVRVPAGSRLTISLGAEARPWVSLPGAGIAVRRLGPGAWQASGVVARPGRLRLGWWLGTLEAWRIDVIPNPPPAIAWDGAPGPGSRAGETRLPWRAAQRWGVARLEAELRPVDHGGAPALTVPVPLPGRPREAHGAAVVDLTANPYAGLAVRGVLRGRDVSGQAGESAAVTFTLPARAFHDPLARSIVALRQRLALAPGAPGAAADDLAALAETPEARTRRAGTFVNLTSVAGLLQARGAAGEAEALDRLWTLALDLDGALPDAAARAVAAAEGQIRRALEDRAHGRITDKQLAERLQALRDAINKRLADIARRAFERGQLGKFDPKGQSFGSPEIERLIRRMQRDSEAGDMGAARRDLAELEQMMRQMDHARVLSPEEAARAAQAQKQADRLAGAVQDLAKRETGLMDRGQQRAPRPGPVPQGWGQDGAPAPPDLDKLEHDEAARGQDAQTERALQRALEALKRGAGQLGAKPPPALDEAGQAMKQAEQALQQGNDSGARAAEGQAVAALMKGGRQLAQAMRGSGPPQLAIVPGGAGGGEQAEAQDEPDGEPRDPLGRPVRGRSGHADDPGTVHVPTEMELGRSRAIQEELRRRAGERTRPEDELNYIDRLLRGE